MANTLENTLNKVGSAVQDIFTGSNEPPVIISNASTGQTQLEKKGMEARKEHLLRNEWRKNCIEYTRQLVLAEYSIQTEFKVTTADDDVATQISNQKSKSEKEAAKAERKAKK